MMNEYNTHSGSASNRSEDERRQEQINKWLTQLTIAERNVVDRRVGLVDGEPQSLDDIGREFHIKLERLRQIEAEALDKLWVIAKNNKQSNDKKMTDDDIVDEYEEVVLTMCLVRTINEWNDIGNYSEYDSSNSSTSFGNEVNRAPIFTFDQELALAKRIAQGDQEARLQLIMNNRRLVFNIGIKFLGKGLKFSEIIKVGTLELIRAVGKVQLEGGLRYSTYASPLIKKAIERAITKKKTRHTFLKPHIFSNKLASSDVNAFEIASLAILIENSALKFASYCLVENYSDKPISEDDLDMARNVYEESLCLYLHIIDRDTFLALSSDIKNSFMNNLLSEVFRLTNINGHGKFPKSSNSDEFINHCNKRQCEYSNIISTDGNIRGTLFWAYGMKIANIMSRSGDETIITEAYASACASINGMKIMKYLENL